MLDMLAQELANHHNYRLSLHEALGRTKGKPNVYALIEIEGNMDDAAVGELRRMMSLIKGQLSDRPLIHVRLFMNRTDSLDRRTHQTDDDEPMTCNRKNERRSGQDNDAFFKTPVQVKNGNLRLEQIKRSTP
jgi:hypothetical protein